MADAEEALLATSRTVAFIWFMAVAAFAKATGGFRRYGAGLIYAGRKLIGGGRDDGHHLLPAGLGGSQMPSRAWRSQPDAARLRPVLWRPWPAEPDLASLPFCFCAVAIMFW